MLTYIVQAKQDYNQEKGSENIMSEKEKKILETIATAVPKMSEFDKGYLLGVGEAMVKQKSEEKNQDKKEDE